MDDTEATQEPVDTKQDTAASTSSALQESSPPDDQLAVLGEHILAELGEARTNSTLARWLAHHVAALIQAADEACAASAPDADARATEARAAILQLWQHRSSWPAGWPPPRAAQVARLLDQLPDSVIPPWQRATPLTRLHELHHTLLAMLVELATADGDDIEQGWLKAFSDLITPDEMAMLTLASTADQRLSRRFGWLAPAKDDGSAEGDDDGDPGDDGAEPARERSPLQALVEIADAYRQTILDLIDTMRESNGSTGDAHAPGNVAGP